MSFFSVNQMTVGYGGRNVVSGISFELEAGSLVGVIGANGSGKTTLLKAICGILPHEGTCSFKGNILEKQTPRQISRLCSYIPQRSGISIDISVLDVVLMGFNPRLGLLERPDSAMNDKALHALQQVGLSGAKERNYMHLSEGQKQLCILARTLVSDSELLLLDEPESSLDFRCRYQMLEILRGWISQEQRGGMITLHDPALALNFCDRLLLLADGRILGKIDPQTDSIEKMEQMLSMIYGSVSLHRCKARDGEERLLMLKENDR